MCSVNCAFSGVLKIDEGKTTSAAIFALAKAFLSGCRASSIHQLICFFPSMNESNVQQSGSTGSAKVIQLLEPEETYLSSNELSLVDIS